MNNQRKSSFRRLQTETFDLVIIGGGASGAGAALDAAQRGLKVALIERSDWAAGTSSRSTKLLHGGVRYLEMAIKKLDIKQLRQVKHGLQERSIVIGAAPHLANQLRLITPVFSWMEGIYIMIGLTLYRWIAGRRDTMPSAQWLKKRTAKQYIPNLQSKVHSAVSYYDGQFDDARYTLLLVLKAQSLGAVCMNYVEFSAFGKSSAGTIDQVTVIDVLDQSLATIRTKQVLNCTGPYSDVVRLAANPNIAPRISASKGVHLSLPLQSGMTAALMIPKTSDGRLLFAIPFQGSLLLGTTDVASPTLEFDPLLSDHEVDFLLEGLNRYLSAPYTRADVRAGFGGLRPLISMPGRTATKQLLRDHEVEQDTQSGLVSLLGGKWTTYRLMAKDAIDVICQNLGIDRVCRTEEIKLPGTENWLSDGWKSLHARYSSLISRQTAKHLHHQYGTLAPQIMQICEGAPELAELLCDGTHVIKAEVVYHARYEMAQSIQDVLARRVRIEYTDYTLAYHAAPAVARQLSEELDWPDGKEEQEAVSYFQYLHKCADLAGITIDRI